MLLMHMIHKRGREISKTDHSHCISVEIYSASTNHFPDSTQLHWTILFVCMAHKTFSVYILASQISSCFHNIRLYCPCVHDSNYCHSTNTNTNTLNFPEISLRPLCMPVLRKRAPTASINLLVLVNCLLQEPSRPSVNFTIATAKRHLV